MSVNMNAAIPDNKRNKNYGKNYYAIDFEMSDRLTANDYANQWNKGARRPVVGVVEIGNSRIPMTLKELEKLRETITDAIYTTDMAYRLGQLK
jgi:hypothetical protein